MAGTQRVGKGKNGLLTGGVCFQLFLLKKHSTLSVSQSIPSEAHRSPTGENSSRCFIKYKFYKTS